MSEMTKEELDPQFKFDVAERLGGRGIKSCLNCGSCTASCPVSEIREGFDPRKIIRMILLGRKKQLLSSDTIWYCSLCNTCSFVCPQGVKFGKAMVVIRQMAVESGYISGSFLDKWQQVEKLCQHFRERVLSSLLEVRDREGEIDLAHLLKDAYMQCTGGD